MSIMKTLQTSSSWLHIKSLLRHIRLAYSTPLPRHILMAMVLVIICVWVPSILGYNYWSALKNQNYRSQLQTQVLTQFRRYETVLLGCRSLFNASEEVTNEEWHEFVYGLDIPTNYPSLTDVAIIKLQQVTNIPSDDTNIMQPDDWSALITDQFCFRNDQPQINKRFDTSTLIRQKLIESGKGNKFACLPAIANLHCSTQSAILLLPIYKRHQITTDPIEHFDNLYGWVGVVVDLEDVLKLNQNNLATDETVKLIYVDSDLLKRDQVSLENLQSTMNRTESKSVQQIAGGVWAVQISSNYASESSLVLLLLNIIFFSGLIISLLISGLLGASISSHQHAMQIIAVKSKALKDTEHRTRQILDSANEAFFACNFTGHVVDWSKQAEKLFGFSKDQIIGRTLAQTIIPNDSPQDATHGGLRQILSCGESGQRIEITAQDISRKHFPIELSVSPMQSRDGFVFNAFAHDITSRKELQAQLSHVQKLESIGELAAGIAHEINTPTQYVGDNTRFLQDAFKELDQAQTAIMQYINTVKQSPQANNEPFAQLVEKLESLDMDFLHDEIPTAITQTLDGIDRVAEIVRSMKNFAHPGTETKQLNDINKSIQSTCVVSRNVWKYVSKLDLQLDPQLPMVNCTPGEINQVILNLIVNAAHAIEDKQKITGDDSLGLITIHTRVVESSVCIEITDTGNGIPESIRQRIYDPFTTTKQVGRGTGQGLAIARTVIVDKHQGKISFQTQEGVGTTFSILLPIDLETSSTPPIKEQQADQVA